MSCHLFKWVLNAYYCMMIPGYIRSSDADSFGRYTICSRFPKIVNDIIENNKGADVRHLTILDEGISSLKIKALLPVDDNVALFNASIEPFLNQGIFDVPFFTAELFFYQLLAEQLDYRVNGLDYFSTLKNRSLSDAVELISGRLAPFPVDWGAITPEHIAQSLHFALWGNLADLSLFTLAKQSPEGSFSPERILIDDSIAFIEFFRSYRGTVHVFLDNAGYELVSDLYLIAVLLLANPYCKIKAHVKPIPMFVSDTTVNDWQLTLAAISDRKEIPLRNWRFVLESALTERRISLTTDPFWSSAYHFSDHWLNVLNVDPGELIICKGDLNYRRFFEDRAWPADTPTEAAVTTTTAPILFLRTLKSEIMTGLQPTTVQGLHITEPDWLIAGKYGIIQFLMR